MKISSCLIVWLIFNSAPGNAIDTISCLKAKNGFPLCAARQKDELFPVRDCIKADSGYEDCRQMEGGGSHRRCLPVRGAYKFCRTNEIGVVSGTTLNHFECARIQSGYKACMKIERNHDLCHNARAGYSDCRTLNPSFLHQHCVAADRGYGPCRRDGFNHFFCVRAKLGFHHCHAVDGYSAAYCIKNVGNGYEKCRNEGYSVAHCRLADRGFPSCIKNESN